MDVLAAPVAARTGVPSEVLAGLVRSAVEPEFQGSLSSQELRVFDGRFGGKQAARLREEHEEELDLPAFAARFGSDSALLLLDAMFAVCSTDGRISRSEVQRLTSTANELGIDPVLVTALLQRHDPRHATGDWKVALTSDRVIIGRAPKCEVALHDPLVALQHAQLDRTPTGWRVRDLESGRPTLVNGLPTHSAPIDETTRLRIGPYDLSLVGDEVRVYGERRFSALSVRHLRRKIGDLVLLDDMSFTVFTGEVVALIGNSGAGKTTLLNAISGIAPADSGEVLLDGEDFHAQLAVDRSLVGNVPQDDLVHPELTVEESLLYSGRLRFPPDVTDKELRTEVDRVLDELGIEHIRHSRIGDTLRRGISGGQRKRVNLGQELITRSTRVLFLDEPTSGLDPRSSQDIVGVVRQLADAGRIVFLVTHDLTPEIINKVDHLIVIAEGGRLAYFGPPTEARRYFGVSTSDAIFNRFGDHTPRVWGQRYRESSDSRKYVSTREHLLRLKGGSLEEQATESRPSPSWFSQFRTLTARHFTTKLRDRTGMLVVAAQPPVLGLIMWLVFPAPTSPMLFMIALGAIWFGMSASVREFLSDRVIWRRERRVGVGVLPYVASKVFVMTVLVGLQNGVLALILFYSMGMAEYGFDPVKLTFITMLTGWVGMSMSLLVSAAWSSMEAAVGTLPLLLIPQITFSSILVSLRDMSAAAKFCTWLTVQRYTFDAVIKCGESYAVWSRRGGEWEAVPISMALYLRGLKPSSGADDLGLSLETLTLVLISFSGACLGVTTLIIFLRGRRG